MNSTSPFSEFDAIAIALFSIKIVLNSAGLLLNCLLLWVFLCSNTKLHKTFRILLAYTQINDILISLTVLLTLQRNVRCQGAVVMIYHGPCSTVSSNFCHLLVSIRFHAYENWIITQILLVTFRMSMITSSKSMLSMKRTLINCFLAWVPGILVLILCEVYNFSPDRLRNLVQKCYEEDFSNEILSGYESFFNSPLPLIIAMLLLPNLPHYFLVYRFHRQQTSQLNSRVMSITTVRMHTTLRKLSAMKAFLPLLLLFDVLIYYFCHVHLLPRQFSEYFIGTLASSIILLNPLIIIVCFRPCRKIIVEYYRSFMSKLFGTKPFIFSEGTLEEEEKINSVQVSKHDL